MSKKVAHYYNYDLMKHINGDTQMDCFRCCEDTTEILPFLADVPVTKKV